MTTVVFPNANVKFYVTASVEERARRRCAELRERGEDVDPESIASEIRLRDERDATRHESPMRIADDAVVVDTTCKTPDEVVAYMAEIVRQRIG